MLICTKRVYQTVVFFSFSLLLTPFAHAQTTATTAQLRPALQILDSTKEQDGLMGAVRRVKTEYARINLRDGKAVEGPRQLLEVTTYGVRGNRVDNVSYPVTDPTVGREEYKYDDRGNIIEKVLRDDHGTVLSREAYDYLFDQVGNWIKMTTNLVVVENGELKREPTEVTYRTLTYFANDTARTNVAAAPAQNNKETTVPATERVEKATGALGERAAAPPEPKTTETQSVTTETTTPAPKPEEPKAEPKAEPKEENKPSSSGGPTVQLIVPASNTPVQVTESQKNEVTAAAPTSESKSPESRTALDAASTESRDTKPPETVKREESNVVAAAPESTKKTETETARQPTSNTTLLANIPVTSASTSSSLSQAMEFYHLGRQRFDAGDVSAAVDAYLESVKLEPNSAEVQLNLGHAYLTLKKDKEAMKAFKEAGRLNPQLAEAFYGLGFSSFRASKYREAMEAFKKAISVTPDMAKAHYGLALAYIELNKMDDALQEYRILQRLDSKLATKLTKAFPKVDLFDCRTARYCR